MDFKDENDKENDNENINHSDILHSTQSYWRAVVFVLRESKCDENLIQMAYEIGESYKNRDRYNTFITAFLRNINEMLLFNTDLYNNIRYYTIELIYEQSVRFPFEFCQAFDIKPN